MKRGFFLSRPLVFLSLAAAVFLPGCASFLELGDHGDDPSEYDRGYVADSSEETGDCTGRPCHTEPVAARAPASTGNRFQETDMDRQRIRDAIDTRDVVLGMSRGEVMESWGQPVQREVAGRGTGGHERWTYGSRYSLNGSRTVIFENGRVAGWSR